jgi:Na+/melibiose symporter-like transporter
VTAAHGPVSSTPHLHSRGIGGYIGPLGSGAAQPDTAIIAIKASLGLVPAVAAILAMLIFTRYPLTGQRYSTMVAETDARKALLAAPASARVRVPATV